MVCEALYHLMQENWQLSDRDKSRSIISRIQHPVRADDQWIAMLRKGHNNVVFYRPVGLGSRSWTACGSLLGLPFGLSLMESTKHLLSAANSIYPWWPDHYDLNNITTVEG